jgi:aminoglycoside phosphotransferase (APT) family kinase protein
MMYIEQSRAANKMLDPLSDDQIKELFIKVGIGSVNQIEKIDVGFSNYIYSVDDKYILKAAKSEGDNQYLQREIYICGVFNGKLPAPTIIHADISKQVLDRVFIIYQKIQGSNLYMKWHEFSVEERRKVVSDICSYLKIINSTPYEEYAKKFNIDTSRSWCDQVVTKINGHMAEIERQQLLEQALIDTIKGFVNDNKHVLEEQKIALTYYDPHFDNFIVQDKKVAGMLDFERTEVFSIDYVLDLVKRMVDRPKKYASAAAEQFIAPQDYADLLTWYKEFYPELFNFSDMDMRLTIYSIAQELGERIVFGNDESEGQLAALVGH